MTYAFRTHLLAALVCGASMWAATQPAQAAPVNAWDIGQVTPFRNDSWSFGEIFTVGTSNITVTSLGALDLGQSGFTNPGGILVGLYRESDQALLASGVVGSSDGLSGKYRFVDIPDVTLSANTLYRVVAVNGADEYNAAVSTPVAVDPRITWDGYAFCSSTALKFCTNNADSDQTWFANFQLDTPRSGVVPEPSSLALLGAGLLALVASRRRGSKA